MATFLVQGKDPSGEVKKPVPKKVPIKPKKSKKPFFILIGETGVVSAHWIRWKVYEYDRNNIVDSKISPKEGEEKESCVACEENERGTGGNGRLKNGIGTIYVYMLINLRFLFSIVEFFVQFYRMIMDRF